MVDCLTRNFVLAAEATGARKLVLAGGVSANTLLRRRMQELCRQNGWQLFMPQLSLCGDNAAMVGAQAYFEQQAGHFAGMALNARPTMSIEAGF